MPLSYGLVPHLSKKLSKFPRLARSAFQIIRLSCEFISRKKNFLLREKSTFPNLENRYLHVWSSVVKMVEVSSTKNYLEFFLMISHVPCKACFTKMVDPCLACITGIKFIFTKFKLLL